MDQDLALKILKACFKTFPNACIAKQLFIDQNINAEAFDKEIIYLVGHDLLTCEIQSNDRLNRFIQIHEPIFITSKGIDYLKKDGGMTRMLNYHFSAR